MPSTSGRSSRPTFTATKRPFRNPATSWSSKDSRSITWHQWQAAYPTDRNTGTSRSFAAANASSPHGYQSTGLWACGSRYGLVARARRLAGRSDMTPVCTADRVQAGPRRADASNVTAELMVLVVGSGEIARAVARAAGGSGLVRGPFPPSVAAAAG